MTEKNFFEAWPGTEPRAQNYFFCVRSSWLVMKKNAAKDFDGDDTSKKNVKTRITLSARGIFLKHYLDDF